MVDSPELPSPFIVPSLELTKSLGEYEYFEPQLSSLIYKYPIKRSRATTKNLKPLLKEIEPGKIKKIGPFTTEIGSPAHVGPHSGSIDFIVPAGSEIVAAANGEVVMVVDHYPDDEYAKVVFNSEGSARMLVVTSDQSYRLNEIIIRHTVPNEETEEFSRYCHLGHKTSKVSVGDQVKAGLIIAKTGWSGWMDRPHLHFQVLRQDNLQDWPEEKFETFQPQWQKKSIVTSLLKRNY
jgi:murein DD-endopeptidase MepM/ murein hydrolase activator NlpD